MVYKQLYGQLLSLHLTQGLDDLSPQSDFKLNVWAFRSWQMSRTTKMTFNRGRLLDPPRPATNGCKVKWVNGNIRSLKSNNYI
jgi:hypothetical protein